MSYRSLKSIFHQFDKARANSEERNRRSSPSALHWQYRIGDYQMFAIVTTEIAVLLERVMHKENEALGLWWRLPQAAQMNYLESKIVAEIQATNDIEQIHSSRREIIAAIDSLTAGDSTRSKRFKEMVRPYLAMTEQTLRKPSDLDGIRRLYDDALSGEVDAENTPDGARFRAAPVHVATGIGAVHTGAMSESAIEDGLSVMLDQMGDDSIPLLIRAVAGHFIFEHIHPFYDGNGRMGRLLLALDLSEILSPVAWLSLSATISDQKNQYYQAFIESENPLNRGDITIFVTTMLGIIAESLGTLYQDLATRSERLDRLAKRMRQVSESSDGLAAKMDDNLRAVLFVLGQAALFAPIGSLTLDDLARTMEVSKQSVRPLTRSLDELGLVETLSKRPLRFRLSEQGRDFLGLPEPGLELD